MSDVAAGEYPVGPARVPAELRRPLPGFAVRAYLAGAALLGFIAAYVALTAWLAWTCYHLFHVATVRPHQSALPIAGAVLAGLMATYLVVALFGLRREPGLTGLEVTEAEQPRLFAFLRRLSAEVGARMPERVLLRPDCIAAVEIEVSLANLVVPPRRQLVLGMGLVNLLSMSELKAVVAHELGHLCQRTSLIGRWSRVTRMIAGKLVTRRSHIDRFLAALMRIGHAVPLLAAIVLIPIAWALRAIIDTLFAAMVRIERAFDRQLELQADLAAVSVAGSDAIVHALHRGHAARATLVRAADLAELEQLLGRPVADLYAVQRRLVDHVRVVAEDPSFGRAPPVPADPAGHRVFDPVFAHPPRTWDTHPPPEERERNAKRWYVAAPADDRDPWSLFDRADELKAELTARGLGRAARVQPVAVATTLTQVDRAMLRRHLQPRYRGLYLDRQTTRAAAEVVALYGPMPADDALVAAIDALYPDEVRAQLERSRDLTDDVLRLRALQDEVFEAAGRVIRYRGADRRRAQLPALIAEVERERDQASRALDAHDARARAAHLAAARRCGPGWERYLRSLLALLHYAEHGHATLVAATAALGRAHQHALVTGRVDITQRGAFGQALAALWLELERQQRAALTVELPPAVAAAITRAPWAGAFQLPPYPPPTIPERVEHAEYWAGRFATALVELREAALDELLAAEDRCAGWVRRGLDGVVAAPAPARLPATYPTATADAKLPPPIPLDLWTRLRVADGPLAIGARFAASVALVGALAVATYLTPGTRVVVYDGLARDVVVTVDGHRVTVPAGEHRWIEIEPGATRVEARTTDGRVIEAFDARCDELRTCLYNVAAATPVLEHHLTYAADAPTPERSVRTERWWTTDADYVFEAPPASMQVSDHDTVHRTALAAQPADPLLVDTGRDRAAMVAVATAHGRWDPTDARFTWVWWKGLAQLDAVAPVLAARLADEPDDVMLRRLEFDEAADPAAVCADHTARAAARPDDAGWQYLALRCAAAPRARWAAVHARWPDDPWIAYGYGYALVEDGEIEDADRVMTRACAASVSLCESVVENLVRVRRLLAGDRAPDLSGLPLDGTQVRMTLGVEPRTIGLALAAGRLADAQVADGASPAMRTLLVGASEGANPDQVAAALTVDLPPGDPRTLLQYALARRGGAAADPARRDAAVASLGPGAEALGAFLAILDRDGALDVAAADAALATTPRFRRAVAHLHAVVQLGDRCPPAWRRSAKAWLFPGERPYLR